MTTHRPPATRSSAMSAPAAVLARVVLLLALVLLAAFQPGVLAISRD